MWRLISMIALKWALCAMASGDQPSSYGDLNSGQWACSFALLVLRHRSLPIYGKWFPLGPCSQGGHLLLSLTLCLGISTLLLCLWGSVQCAVVLFASVHLFTWPCMPLPPDTMDVTHSGQWSIYCDISMPGDTSNPLGWRMHCGPQFRMWSTVLIPTSLIYLVYMLCCFYEGVLLLYYISLDRQLCFLVVLVLSLTVWYIICPSMTCIYLCRSFTLSLARSGWEQQSIQVLICSAGLHGERCEHPRLMLFSSGWVSHNFLKQFSRHIFFRRWDLRIDLRYQT